ncbi:MAG: hypothetical protein FWH14_07285 [Oscillospiraceae bacterium]|nr:hypothetical protein [Oscillospiraceae bacterium]
MPTDDQGRYARGCVPYYNPLPSLAKRVPPQRRVFFELSQTLCIPLALPSGELSAATPTERAWVCNPVHTVVIAGGVVCRGGNLPPVCINRACRDDRPRSSVVIDL